MASPLIGLIAGAGDLPLHFARRARQEGYGVKAVAIRGAASPRLDRLCRETAWISLGQLGALVSFFKDRGVRKAVMQGKVQHSHLFRNLRLDWRALSLWRRLKDRSGPALLKAVASELSANGTRLLDARFLMEDLLAPKGWVTRVRADAESEKTLRRGLGLARRMAGLDVGQTLMLKKNAVVAVEAMEGTDEAILRAGKWAGRGTLAVKTAGPRQDWRFDVPTVGPRTIRSLAKAGAKGIVVEAGKAFLLDRERTAAEADRNGIFILGV